MKSAKYLTVIEYIDEHGRSPFSKWFSNLDALAAERITDALYRLAHGHTSNTKSVGKGVFEYKINFGPGYWFYFALDSETFVILLYGGTKKRQQKDITLAQKLWRDYKKSSNK